MYPEDVNRDLPLAVLVGLLVGIGMYWLLVPSWFVAVGTATVYAGAAYFYFAFETSLLGSSIQFDDRVDRFGHAIGLFGLSISPIAFGNYYGQQGRRRFPL